MFVSRPHQEELPVNSPNRSRPLAVNDAHALVPANLRLSSPRRRRLHDGWRIVAAALCTWFVAGNAAAERAYVPNEGSGNITVIDTATDRVIATLPAKGSLGKKIQQVEVSADGKRLYVAEADASDVLELDARDGRILKRRKTGGDPEGLKVSPSGRLLAVCLEETHEVALLSLPALSKVRTIRTQGRNPEHCVFSPDGKWLLASNEETSDVDLIDVAAGRSVALIKTAGHPRGIVFLSGGREAWVAQESVGKVDVIDMSERKVVASIAAGLRANGLIVGRDGKRVYVTNGGDGNVQVIDTATRQVVATVPVGRRPWNMALTSDGRKLYVANGRSDTVSVIDTTKNEVLGTIPVGKLPWGVAIR